MAWFGDLDEIELLEFFGSEAVEKSPEDGYWCYEASNSVGLILRFSLWRFLHDVQTVILFGNTVLSTVYHQGATHMDIRRGILSCAFESGDTKASLLISIEPDISVTWSTTIGG